MKPEDREYSPRRFAISGVSCPACHAKLERDARWCAGCGFTGQKTLGMFGENAPPLLPILDVANLWDMDGERRIRAELKAIVKRFPQIRWRICVVALEPEVSLPLFGLWLVNAAPLAPDETKEDRQWTVLLVADSNSGRASVTTGYRSEVWLSDRMWGSALAKMLEPLRAGQAERAVILFLKKARVLLEKAWKRSRKQLAEE